MSGKWFKVVPYTVRRQDHRIDMDEVATLARQHKPKVIVAGGSAYPRTIDFAKFRAIADEVGAFLMVDMAHFAGLVAGGSAYARIFDFKRFREIADSVGAFLMVDMAHFAGLVAGGVHPTPLEHAHVVTTTTHKTLRGPRGGMILSNDEALGKKINSAVFPGLQGGPLMHVIAAKAVAFGEALKPEFKTYAKHVVENAKVLAETLHAEGLDIVSGGTDTHLMLVDLRPKKATGRPTERALDRASITTNKNAVPFDTEKPAITSGIRLGSPAGTTRGFGPAEFREIGKLIVEVIDAVAKNGDAGDPAVEASVAARVSHLCKRFPIYR